MMHDTERAPDERGTSDLPNETPGRCRRRRRQRGFTLIELLIVIGIIGTLAAVLLPAILETGSAADSAATEATMIELETAIKKFNRAEGYYPTDDLRVLKKGVKPDWKPDNGHNTGIESLVVMLSQNKKEGTDLGGLAKHFTNTDGDLHGADLPLLSGRKDRIEIADAWGTPLVYFSKLNMDKKQSVQPSPDDAPVQVGAKKRADGTYYGAGKYQLLSAGADLTFGTDDDQAWPNN